MDKQTGREGQLKQLNRQQPHPASRQQPSRPFAQKDFFGELMRLYRANYQLMKALNVFAHKDEIEIQLRYKDTDGTYPLPAYRLHIQRLDARPYTETLQLTYNLQKHEPQKPVPLVRVNVGVYHDTCQVGATVMSNYNPKYTPFALRIPQAAHLQSLSQRKYYNNAMLCAMLERLVHHNQSNSILDLCQLH